MLQTLKPELKLYLFSQVTNQLVHALQQYVNISIVQGEEDRLWKVVEHEVKNLDCGQSALVYMKTKNKKKQVHGYLYKSFPCERPHCPNSDTFLIRPCHMVQFFLQLATQLYT